jgi:Zn finger protein HypA/HybF involved in hydrogenase expression
MLARHPEEGGDMSYDESETRECPFCKEEVKAGAVRCKHCHAAIATARPAHGGTCPYCKEAIHPEALRCKHCKANLDPRAARAGCEDCGGTGSAVGGRRVLPRDPGRRADLAGADASFPPDSTGGHCEGCPANHADTVEGQQIVWTLVSCDATQCMYEAQGIV